MATKYNNSQNTKPTLNIEGDLAQKLQSSPIFQETLKIYYAAPRSVKDVVEDFQKKLNNDVARTLKAALNLPVGTENLEAFSMVAAVEFVRSSPIPVGSLIDRQYRKNVLNKIEFGDWTLKYMRPGAYNLMTTAKDYYSLTKNQEALGLNAASGFAAKKRVLMVLENDQKAIDGMMILVSKEFASVDYEAKKNMLKMIRLSETQVKVPAKSDTTMPSFGNSLKVN
jgi:hypothetical protein